jgi:hypothetical protein
MGFRKGWRITDSIFILRTIMDKHLARKRGENILDICRFTKSFRYSNKRSVMVENKQKGNTDKIYRRN